MSVSVAGVVLASGMSTRFGAANKLLARVNGVPVIRRTVGAYADAALEPLIVVVADDAGKIRQELADLPVSLVVNPEYRLGQSRALVRGISALPEHVAAAVVGVADQPFLTGDTIRSMADRFELAHPPIVAPCYAGKSGNPVLFARRLFPELLEVEGDQGGRGVVQRHRAAIAWVEVEDGRAARDIDTVADLNDANRETG